MCVLKGAINFMSDLMRAIELPVEVDFMAVSSYGAATKTSGVVRIVKDLDVDLLGRDVLIVEDVVDSGLTLNYLRQYLGARSPTSLEVCALLLKEGEQRVEQSLKYVGFTIPLGLRGRLRTRRQRALPQPRRDLHLHRRGLDVVDQPRVQRLVRELLEAIGEDPTRDGTARDAASSRRHVRRTVRGHRDRSRRAPARHLRDRTRRDGDGARHPLHVAVRAPPRAVRRLRARGLPARSRGQASRDCRSWRDWSRVTRGVFRSKSA